jgi:hypothetical protein
MTNFKQTPITAPLNSPCIEPETSLPDSRERSLAPEPDESIFIYGPIFVFGFHLHLGYNRSFPLMFVTQIL